MHAKILSIVDTLAYSILHCCSPGINSTEANYGIRIPEIRVGHDRRNNTSEDIALSTTTEQLGTLQMLFIPKLKKMLAEKIANEMATQRNMVILLSEDRCRPRQSSGERERVRVCL